MAKLPKYNITISDEYSDGEDLGWRKTAFTSKPAVIIKGMAYEAQEAVKEMFFADKLKYRIAAPAMIPMQIYRNMDNEEFYVEFTEKEIERIHKKFMKNLGKNKNLFNLEHDNSEIVPAYLLEILLIDSQAKVEMILSDYSIKVPIGTLFVIAQVTDKEYYNKLVENGQTGFSIEGFLGLSLEDLDQKKDEEEITLSTDGEFTINNKTNNNLKMENKDLMLPEGAKFQIGDKWYEVKDGVVIESMVEDVAMSEDEVADEVVADAEDVVEEEVAMSEDVVEEEVAEVVEEEMAEEVIVVESYSKEEVDAKFDELYKMIAELKTEEVIEDKKEEVMLSAHDRVSEYVRFSKK